MARKKTTIKSEMTLPFMANETLAAAYGFAPGALFDNEFSLVSLENIIFEIVAQAIFLFELIFDQHTKEVNETINNKKPGTKPWYRDMALAFQYGFDLVPDHDYFDNSNTTTEQVVNSKIVKYSAVNEASESSRVILKIAGENDGVLSPITLLQKNAFDTYIEKVRIAGIKVTVINYLPDLLYLNIQIKRNALVLESNGQSILDGNFPVNDAIEEYMKELPFDGDLRLSSLVDKLQQVSGVIDATIISAASSWINPDINDYELPQPIMISKIPVSGYYEVVNYDNINYVV